MTRHSLGEGMDRLKVDVVTMGARAEQAIERALTALFQGDRDLAGKVVAGDAWFDRMEVETERACLTLIALQQPLAHDLRLVGSTLKMLTDLERMADHAADIAKILLRLPPGRPAALPADIPRMATAGRSMTRDALDAYVREDAAKALAMIARDDEVDGLFANVFREALRDMARDADAVESGGEMLMVASHLERIGDHATNLGEWIVYMVTGERLSLND